jgi:integrase
MSSISSDKAGQRTIYVRGVDARRRPVRLGKVSMKQTRTVQGYIDDLERVANHNGTPTEKTSKWLDDIGDELHRKLARVGLVAPRESVTLGAFIDGFIERRKGTVKPATLVRMKQARGHLVRYFREDKPLVAITSADAEDYRAWLLATGKGRGKCEGERQGMAEATVRRTCGYARQWFTYAMKRGYVRINPFTDVPTAVTGNTARQRFISGEDARKVMEKLPDAQWRLLFALGRWGGLRVISEPIVMTWQDVDWESRRLIVRSSKTEHHPGHDKRVIPLFSEIEEPLREVFEIAPERSLHVLPFLQNRTSAALRKPLIAAIEAAGLTVWPRLWHNLRASRQTELMREHASHVVCAWIGNSEKVAEEHYLQVLDSDYDRALEVVRHPVRAMAIDPANDRQVDNGNPRENAISRQKLTTPAFAGAGEVGPAGLEPATSPLSGVRSAN